MHFSFLHLHHCIQMTAQDVKHPMAVTLWPCLTLAVKQTQAAARNAASQLQQAV